MYSQALLLGLGEGNSKSVIEVKSPEGNTKLFLTMAGGCGKEELSLSPSKSGFLTDWNSEKSFSIILLFRVMHKVEYVFCVPESLA